MKSPLLTLLKPFLIFLVALLDDALLIAFSRIGLHVTWLQWLAPVVLGVTLLHCIGQVGRFLDCHFHAQALTSSSNCFSKVRV